jgi:hypothetical protein
MLHQQVPNMLMPQAKPPVLEYSSDLEGPSFLEFCQSQPHHLNGKITMLSGVQIFP